MDTLICAVFKQFGDAQNAFFVETIREFHKAVIKVNCFTSIWSLYGNFVACNCICCFACYVAFFVNRERDACGDVVSIRSCCLRKSIGSCCKFYCVSLNCSIFGQTCFIIPLPYVHQSSNQIPVLKQAMNLIMHQAKYIPVLLRY